MNGRTRAVAVAALAAAVAFTLALRGRQDAGPAAVTQPPVPAQSTAPPAATPASATATAEARPRLLELGSNRCVSCQEMAKVLDALRASQGGRLRVDFVDVFEDPDAAERYAVKLIPTQILYDADGREIHRHTGYFPHDDILAKFRELGVML